MKKVWLRLSRRERAVLSVALLLFFLVLARYLVVEPYLGRRAWVSSQLEILSQRLERERRYVARGGELEETIRQLEAKLKELESGLLEGDTAPVVASALQQAIGQIAAREGVQIVAAHVPGPQPVGVFLRVPVQTEVSGEMVQVVNFIRGIDSSSKLLSVNEITIRSLFPAPGQRGAPGLQGSLRASVVISGFARHSAPSPEPKKGAGRSG